jgi:hypothetical protein
VYTVVHPRLKHQRQWRTPDHLAEKIFHSKATLEGERKQVTMLFADLNSSMELLAARDPEEARHLLDPVLERMMAAVGLARRLTTILPAMPPAEALDTTRIHRVAGRVGARTALVTARSCRAAPSGRPRG